MSKHGYVLTINSKYIESEHPNKDEMKEWHNAICKLAEMNTEILNKRTKNEEEALPFYRYIAVGPMECGKKEGRYHCHAYVYCTKQKTIKVNSNIGHQVPTLTPPKVMSNKSYHTSQKNT